MQARFSLIMLPILLLVLSLCRPASAAAQAQAPPPGGLAAAPNSPEALPEAFKDATATLKKEISDVRSRTVEAGDALSQARKGLQELEIEAAALKAYLAVQNLPPMEAERLSKAYDLRQSKMNFAMEAIGYEGSKVKADQALKASTSEVLEAQMDKLQKLKVLGAWNENIEDSYEAYQRTLAAHQHETERLTSLLQSRWLVLEEEGQLLDSMQSQLKSLVETWRVELLKREQHLPLRDQAVQIWKSFTALPHRAYQWANAFVQSGRLQSAVRKHYSTVLGLIVILSLFGWASRKLHKAIISWFRTWKDKTCEDGVRGLFTLGEILVSMVFPIGLTLGTGLAFHAIGILETTPALITLDTLAALVVLRFLHRLVKAFFGRSSSRGILPLDDDTGRFFRHNLRKISTYLVLGILGLQVIALLEFPLSTRHFLLYLFELGLMIWSLSILRRRQMEKLLAVVCGPAWMIKASTIQTMRAVAALLLMLSVLPYLLGFQSLSMYVAWASTITGGILISWHLLSLSGQEVLHFWLHSEEGWFGRRYPNRAEVLGRLCALARQGYAILLSIGGVLSVLAAWGVEPQGILKAFQWLNWGINIGPVRFTPVSVVLAAFLLYFGIWLSRFISTFLQIRVFPRTGWDIGIQYTISKILQYVILIVGTLLALTVLGFPLANLALIMGALGVGVGLGLQNIVSNFVSGLILLIERPIKVGDMLVIDGQWGEVKQIRMRSTVFETYDRSVLIIPNTDLTASKIVNWTHFGRGPNRIKLTVGVSYEADVRKVTQLLADVCRDNCSVLQDPAPTISLQSYGESSLDFTIWAHVASPADRVRVTHELNVAIFEAFKEHSIEIPFPQRDLYIKNWPENLVRAIP